MKVDFYHAYDERSCLYVCYDVSGTIDNVIREYVNGDLDEMTAFKNLEKLQDIASDRKSRIASFLLLHEEITESLFFSLFGVVVPRKKK
jgi:hypothetical protein